jgi:hypothetical protein
MSTDLLASGETHHVMLVRKFLSQPPLQRQHLADILQLQKLQIPRTPILGILRSVLNLSALFCVLA